MACLKKDKIAKKWRKTHQNRVWLQALPQWQRRITGGGADHGKQPLGNRSGQKAISIRNHEEASSKPGLSNKRLDCGSLRSHNLTLFVRLVGRDLVPRVHEFCPFFPFGAIRGVPLLRLPCCSAFVLSNFGKNIIQSEMVEKCCSFLGVVSIAGRKLA